MFLRHYYLLNCSCVDRRATDTKPDLTIGLFFYMNKDNIYLKPAAIVMVFLLSVVARNLLSEEKVKFRAFIGEMILAVIFGLLLVFLGIIRTSSFPETMLLSCISGLGINRGVSWIALPIIQQLTKGGKK